MYSLGMTGKFEFKSPANNIVDDTVEYTITSIRRIKEVFNNREDPLVTIYGVLGISEEVFNADLEKDILIIGIKKVGGNRYTYVPETFITTVPNLNGVRYVEKLLVLSLGKIPVDLDLTNLKDVLLDKIRTSTNLEVQIKEIDNSSIEMVDSVEHDAYMLRYNNLASKELSYEEKYYALVESSQRLWDLTDNLNNALKIEIKDGTIIVNP